MGILDIKNLAISFDTEEGRLYALRGVDLSLGEREVLALVGESGSGKSVTSKAVLGLLPQTARIDGGEIIYRGESLLEKSYAEMSRIRGGEISMVPQDPFLSLDPITKVGHQIAESVRLNADVRGRAAKKLAFERALGLMREVGIHDAEHAFFEYPFRFSGGMRQRIAIAAALAPSPRVLICDEPTTALDVTIEAQILELLERLKRERGLSMLFITHDLGVVARVADRVAVMYAGRIVEVGTAEDVFYDPRHPYTWALMSSVPEAGERELAAIPGSVPDMRCPPTGDAFASRNAWAMRIDYVHEPPMFEISPTHKVASWLCHPDAPKTEPPKQLAERIARYLSKPGA